jgi:hypothetical protein
MEMKRTSRNKRHTDGPAGIDTRFGKVFAKSGCSEKEKADMKLSSIVIAFVLFLLSDKVFFCEPDTTESEETPVIVHPKKRINVRAIQASPREKNSYGANKSRAPSRKTLGKISDQKVLGRVSSYRRDPSAKANSRHRHQLAGRDPSHKGPKLSDPDYVPLFRRPAPIRPWRDTPDVIFTVTCGPAWGTSVVLPIGPGGFTDLIFVIPTDTPYRSVTSRSTLSATVTNTRTPNLSLTTSFTLLTTVTTVTSRTSVSPIIYWSSTVSYSTSRNSAAQQGQRVWLLALPCLALLSLL